MSDCMYSCVVVSEAQFLGTRVRGSIGLRLIPNNVRSFFHRPNVHIRTFEDSDTDVDDLEQDISSSEPDPPGSAAGTAGRGTAKSIGAEMAEIAPELRAANASSPSLFIPVAVAPSRTIAAVGSALDAGLGDGAAEVEQQQRPTAAAAAHSTSDGSTDASPHEEEDDGKKRGTGRLLPGGPPGEGRRSSNRNNACARGAAQRSLSEGQKQGRRASTFRREKRHAKRNINSLRFALLDLYRRLNKLQNYAMVNFMACIKITKKHDKHFQTGKLTPTVMRLISRKRFNHYAAEGHQLPAMISKMEKLYAKRFTDGNQRVARATLLAKQNIQHSWGYFHMGP